MNEDEQQQEEQPAASEVRALVDELVEEMWGLEGDLCENMKNIYVLQPTQVHLGLESQLECVEAARRKLGRLAFLAKRGRIQTLPQDPLDELEVALQANLDYVLSAGAHRPSWDEIAGLERALELLAGVRVQASASPPEGRSSDPYEEQLAAEKDVRDLADRLGLSSRSFIRSTMPISKICRFCGQSVNPADQETLREIQGFESKNGEELVWEPSGNFVHRACALEEHRVNEKRVGKSGARDDMQDPGEDVMEEIARARGFNPNPDVQPSSGYASADDYAVGALRIALERAGKKGQDAYNAFGAEYETELRKAGITTEGDDAGKPGRK